MSRSTRFKLAHIVLPSTMHELSEGLFSYLQREKENALPLLYRMAGTDPCPYPASSFSVDYTRLQAEDRDIQVIRITMPQPEEVGDCRSAYLCREMLHGQMLYFTSELSKDGVFPLHVWMTSRVHLYFGAFPDAEEFDHVVTLFKELILNGKLKTVIRLADKSVR